MITSLALSLIAIASGTLLTYTYDDAPLAARVVQRRLHRLCVSWAWLALSWRCVFGLNALTIGMTAVVLCCRVLTRQTSNSESNQCGHRLGAQGISPRHVEARSMGLHLFSVLCRRSIVMWLVFDRALLNKPDGLLPASE
jgi:hypothetical protein